MQKVLIVGSGDVARRALPWLVGRYRVFALVRNPANAEIWRSGGAIPVLGDLDRPVTLRRLAGLADYVLHFAPPPGEGDRDSRSRRLAAVLARGRSLPRALVYVSTTGVYGDCGGAVIDETRPAAPRNPRARRRVDAEGVLRDFGRRGRVRVAILRAPGIYAAERLPVERLRAGSPALRSEEDVHTNHIHAADLARACCLALARGRANRVYNVVDDTDLPMGDFLDAVADALSLPRPPRVGRREAEQILTPIQMSFLRESRRIDNRRVKDELGLRLAFPTVATLLRSLA
ncbi:MAG: NAD-dependent epimerase/dehydratase family protein [Betaproteobacteria bacterium]|nr:NAD-dependent epimerase/dehydratase family protein [Betaproteobacteria bacterium]HMV20183.1 NAD-dependent epimerase/dehydratase family protein [Rhodocyclaceae bacterium]HMW77710.1 NAD-dependent epimerase/dehydratase family protein [Rhodocyclaceae bacterium]HNE42740.1 NAD-dependent epimerase/dehydratase family protein [Rhodocyclaceae bacterium]HNL21346.1 NAD-dependent epimerase/dehydratase family protein [Rhodocyclaceae bacterium]